MTFRIDNTKHKLVSDPHAKTYHFDCSKRLRDIFNIFMYNNISNIKINS